MRYQLNPPLSPRNGRTLKVLGVARISGPNQDEQSLEDQEALHRRWTREHAGQHRPSSLPELHLAASIKKEHMIGKVRRTLIDGADCVVGMLFARDGHELGITGEGLQAARFCCRTRERVSPDSKHGEQ